MEVRSTHTPRAESIITQEIVRELLDYSPFTGLFTWKWRDIRWFDPNGFKGAKRNQCSWNAKWAGKPAFCTPRVFETNTYLWGCLLWESLAAHRVAFLYMTGRWPDEVDHRDGDGTNNRWRNLREVTREVNMQNRRRGRTHKGEPLLHRHMGIKLNGSGYGARITIGKRNVWLGTFDTLEEAIAVRKAAEQYCGFTERHGS